MRPQTKTSPTLVADRQVNEVLLPVSLGRLDNKAIGIAIRMAEAWALPLRLVHVSDSIDPHHPALEAVAADLRTLHPDTEIRTSHVFGHDVPTGIASAVSARSFLMMATDRADEWAHKGSIAEALLFSAGVPLLLFGPSADHFDVTGEVIIGLDGSAGAEAAMDVGIHLARSLGTQPWLVQVVAQSRPDELHPEVASYIQDQAALQEPHQHTGWELIHSNDPVTSLVRFAAARDAGVIVAGARGRTDPHRESMGSITMGLVSNATQPVLAVAVNN